MKNKNDEIVKKIIILIPFVYYLDYLIAFNTTIQFIPEIAEIILLALSVIILPYLWIFLLVKYFINNKIKENLFLFIFVVINFFIILYFLLETFSVLNLI